MTKTRNKHMTASQVAMSRLTTWEKIVALAAIAVTHHRLPAGDRAWDEMRKIAGMEQTQAISFLMGFGMGAGTNDMKWEDLIPRTKS